MGTSLPGTRNSTGALTLMRGALLCSDRCTSEEDRFWPLSFIAESFSINNQKSTIVSLALGFLSADISLSLSAAA
jgi:hypothetical protein